MTGVMRVAMPDPRALTLTVSVLALSLLWWLSTRRPSRLPPGPGLALPLLGHMHLLKRDPRPQFNAWRRRYGDVFSLYMGPRLVVVLNGYRVIRDALVGHADVFSHRPHLPLLQLVSNSMGIVNSSGDQWKAQRTTALEILRELNMGKNPLAEKIQEEVGEYVKAVCAKDSQPFDLTPLTQMSVSNNICSVIFGKRYEYDDKEFTGYLRAVEDYFKACCNSSVSNFFTWLRFLPGDMFDIKKKASIYCMVKDTFIQPIIDSHLQDHDENHVEDFIGAYIRDMRSDHKRHLTQYVNETNLLRVIMELFGGGSETTSTVIRWAVIYFLHYPQVQQKCHDEIVRVVGTGREPNIKDRQHMTYLEATISEVMRHASVVPLGVPHSTSEDVSFAGYVIPKGAYVIVRLDTALHDPEVWQEPDKFHPERFIGADGKLLRREGFIPFSTGRRVCLGESLARMELFLYLSVMLQRFRFLPPEDGQLPSLQGVLGITRCPEAFQVRAVPRYAD